MIGAGFATLLELATAVAVTAVVVLGALMLFEAVMDRRQ